MTLETLQAKGFAWLAILQGWLASPQFYAQVIAIAVAWVAAKLLARQLLARVPLLREELVSGKRMLAADRSITNGVFDAADFSFTGLTSTPSVEALVIFVENGGANTTWPLVAYIDTATGLPVAAGASQVDIVWDKGTNKIFKL